MSVEFKELILPGNCESFVENQTLYLTKWNWDYQDFLIFQKNAQKLVQHNRKLRVYIFCNHPHCFTLGRGNERGRDDLVSFDEKLEIGLKYPLHKIHRGGGISFHFPGQWI